MSNLTPLPDDQRRRARRTDSLEWRLRNIGWTVADSGCWEWNGGKSAEGYGLLRYTSAATGRTMLPAHRIAYAAVHGPIPDGMHIDHRCHNHACMNPAHLRLTTPKQNSENRDQSTVRARSGVLGVYWHAARNKWGAKVKHNGKNYYLGMFATVEEAESVVRAKRLELFTHNDQDRKPAA